VDKYFCLAIILFLLSFSSAYSQDVPEDAVQVDFNSYFDNFNVTVIFPSVSLDKKISKTTSITGRYLTDIITAASMKSTFNVDGITSATSKHVGGGDDHPDEWRHELGLGFTQQVGEGVISFNGGYSTEHDYSSRSFIGNISYPFAKKNTVLHFGFLGSWDKVFPQVRTWTKPRNTLAYDLSLTQILSKSWLAQLIGSYSTINGYMSNGYQVVRIITNDSLHTLDVVEPDYRVHRTAGFRTNIGVSKGSTIELDYRYYWDSWDINSHTITGSFKTHFSKHVNAEFEYRQYFQTRAYFFKPVYTQIEQYMAVEGSLNSGYSNEGLVTLTFGGFKNSSFPFMNSDKMELHTTIGYYHRHTDSADWFSLYSELYAYLFTLGFKYNF
jgi:hypothetical protein